MYEYFPSISYQQPFLILPLKEIFLTEFNKICFGDCNNVKILVKAKVELAKKIARNCNPVQADKTNNSSSLPKNRLLKKIFKPILQKKY